MTLTGEKNDGDIYVSNIQTIENYLNFGVQNNRWIAYKLLQEYKQSNPLDKNQRQHRKLYFIRIFFELIQATEVLHMVLCAIRNKKEIFIANMAECEVTGKSVIKEMEYINTYERNKLQYFTKSLDLDITEAEYKEKKEVFDDLYNIIKDAHNDRTVKHREYESALVKAYHKIKHGFPIMDFELIKPEDYESLAIHFTGLPKDIHFIKVREERANEMYDRIDLYTKATEFLLSKLLATLKKRGLE